MKKPIVWSIAGVDPAGLSGTHVDLETLKNFNVDSCSIITAVTAQNASTVAIDQLQRWRRTLHYPLVAIGGMNFERLPEILKVGVEGVSLISAITKADNPLTATQQFLTQIKELSDG